MDMRTYRTIFALVGFAALSTLFALPAHAQLRIVTYNVANGTANTSSPRSGMREVLQAMGVESRNGIAKPVDVLLIQESYGQSTTAQAYVDMLNSIYGAGTYAHGSLGSGVVGGNNSDTTGAGTQSIIYRTSSVSLVAETMVGTLSDPSNPDRPLFARKEIRYQLRPVGYGSDADIFVYNGHWKAGDDAGSRDQRNAEAQIVRANADALGANKNVMYVGDMNIYRSSESMWGTLTAAGNAQAFDPINRVGTWHDNADYLDIHTQSPTVSTAGGFTGGGMDDRFDLQLVSGSMIDGHGTSYINGSYHTFGNTGSHALNGALNVGRTNTDGTKVDAAGNFAAFLPGYTSAQAQTILDNLTMVSDHLPVIADYRIPARMGVTVAGAPVTVITGASVGVTVTVANTANVVASNGADTLDFAVSGSGALSGSASGTDAALGGSISNTLAFNTTVAGVRTGTVSASSTSEAVANGTFSQNVSMNVLDHANASFSTLSDVNSLTIDFGNFTQGSGLVSQNFSIANLVATNGFTAGLDLDSFTGTGNTGILRTSLAAFANQLAGTSSSYSALFDTATAGDYSSVYTLNFSDQDLPGATSISGLQLTLRGRVTAAVVPEADTVSLFGIGGLLGLAGIRLRRRKA